jgi:hypothetical protein
MVLGAPRRVVRSLLLKAGYKVTRIGVPEDIDDGVFLTSMLRCQPYTATSPERMYALWQAVEHIERHEVPGDIVECGVWRGGSSMLAAIAAGHFANSSRRLWLFDTFDGMPAPGPNDVYRDGRAIAADWRQHTDPSDRLFAYASLEEVQRNIAMTNYPTSNVNYVRGKVEDTLPRAPIEHVSVLRLDTDWYESTKLELEVLWDRLSPSGVLVIDDYGHWRGARRAVDEFFADRRDAPLLVRVDETGRMAVRCT